MKNPRKTDQIPAAACSLVATAAPRLTLADGAGEPGRENPREAFEMAPVASGRPILGHWYWGNLALDLAGVELPDRTIPALKDHDADQRVGFADRLEVVDGVGLVASGQLLKTSAAAQSVIADARDGFPWQSSVHAVPLSVELLDDGETAEVNGYSLEGPGAVFRAWKVREVSFTALGADDAAAAAVASFHHQNETYEVATMKNETTKPAETPPVTLSADDLRNEYPQQIAEVAGAALADGQARGVELERRRVRAILSQASAEQAELVEELIADGVDENEAAAAINRDLRERLEIARAGATAEAPIGGAKPAGNPEPLTTAESAGAEYDASAELRAEFPDRLTYVQFRLAESAGRIRRHAPRSGD